jgi:hypothetical protein
MNVAKKIAKWLLWAVVSVVGLLLLVSVLVYLPPMQNFVKGRASAWLSESMGLGLDVERFRLRFPLTLAVDNTTVRTAAGDTLLHVGRLRARVAMLPLLKGEVEMRRFRIADAAIDRADSAMSIRGRVGSVVLNNLGVRLARKEVSMREIAITDADIELALGVADTVAVDKPVEPWKVAVGSVDLERVHFAMTGTPQFAADLDKGRVADIAVDMAAQSVDARSVRLERGRYSYRAAYASGVVDTLSQDAPSRPWTIALGRVELMENAVEYRSGEEGGVVEGFDPRHIAVSALSLRADSVYNRGSDISLNISELELQERSGLWVNGVQGHFAMDSAGVRLRDFVLTTNNRSRVEAAATADAGIVAADPLATLSAAVDAQVAAADIFLLHPPDSTMLRALGGKTLTVGARVDGRLDDLTIETLNIALPSNVAIDASGRVRSLTDPRNAAGNMRVDARLTDIGFVRDFLPDSIGRRVGFPQHTTLTGSVAFGRGDYAPDLHVTADGGTLDMKGHVNIAKQTYDVSVTAADFPLGSLLPADSLGMVSLRLTAAGSGFDPRVNGAAADIDLAVERFDYRGYNFHDAALRATLAQNRLQGTLHSASDALALDVDVTGEMTAGQYAAQIAGRVTRADIAAMGFSATPLVVSGRVDVDASMGRDTAQLTYTARAVLDSVALTYDGRRHSVERTTLDARADTRRVITTLRSGDIYAVLNAPVALRELTGDFARVADTLTRQVAARDFRFGALGDAFRAGDRAEFDRIVEDMLAQTEGEDAD